MSKYGKLKNLKQIVSELIDKGLNQNQILKALEGKTDFMDYRIKYVYMEEMAKKKKGIYEVSARLTSILLNKNVQSKEEAKTLFERGGLNASNTRNLGPKLEKELRNWLSV